MPDVLSGFVLSRHWRDTSTGIVVDLWLATSSGPLKVSVPHQRAVFFIQQADVDVVVDLLQQHMSHHAQSISIVSRPLRNMHGQAVAAVYCQQQARLRQVVDILHAHDISHWEADVRPSERFLMERFIFGSLAIPASTITKTKTGVQIAQVESVVACEYSPSLSMVSLDIETSMSAQLLYSIGVYGPDCSIVFMVGEPQENTLQETELVFCANAQVCLQQFLVWLNAYDPDVIVGWHVVQFDLWVLASLCKRHGVPFTLGRNNTVPHWRNDGGRHFIQVQGRVVLDGIELLRSAFYHFERFSLNYVAQQLLGETKLLQGGDRGSEITQLFHTDKLALAEYNIQDCKLVWSIFEKTQLLAFAIARAQLTGLPIDKMGGSVAGFDYSYLPRLHRQGYVAPNVGELESDVISPGGYVMDSLPGLYQHVLVLDFKSLYPSIIRTFLIDPCAYWQAKHNESESMQVVPGFNGATFSRSQPILPDLVAHLWQRREQSKAEHNQPLSQAIKIIMNSFYGVLGSQGCRFFDPKVCSSITLRGHEIIQASMRWIEEQGHYVIYGDTDSIFVWLGDFFTPVDANAECAAIGHALAQELNAWWQQKIEQEFALSSYLEIEFETHYHHFLMPTIRGSDQGSKKRYAGMVTTKSGDMDMVFKGLETVRSDWTQLAKQFQQKLYKKVFLGQPYQQYIRETVDALRSSASDSLLVYRKRLRRQPAEYQKSNPPHVKAARIVEQYTGEALAKGDHVEYVITLNGPEPIGFVSGAIDYSHYIEKQLKPIADSILNFSDESFDEIVQPQIRLV